MATDAMLSLFSAHPMVAKRLISMRVEPTCPRSDVETNWSCRASRSVVKALARYRILEDFDSVISQKSPNSKCVLIQRCLECRLVADDPVVCGNGLTAICKLWRWPDLVTYLQLQPSNNCHFSIQSDQECICVNPFHYEKCQFPTPPSVVVPCPNNTLATNNSRNNSDDNNSLIVDCNNGSADDASSDDVTMSEECPPEYNALVATNMDGHQPPMYDVSEGSAAISYVEPVFWCSVSYYELNHRVGAIFHASQSSLTVDGFTDPSCPDRFCLGTLSNITRNPESEECRKRIVHGVRLYYIGGEVYVECLSENPVFAQSLSCNLKQGWHPATVCKIPPGCNLKIFNNQQFAELLSKTLPEGFEAVYQLTRMCTIRMSFVKGWGSEYKRQTITSTPCWIEIHLNGPLQWLDRVMACLQPPGTLSTN